MKTLAKLKKLGFRAVWFLATASCVSVCFFYFFFQASQIRDANPKEENEKALSQKALKVFSGTFSLAGERIIIESVDVPRVMEILGDWSNPSGFFKLPKTLKKKVPLEISKLGALCYVKDGKIIIENFHADINNAAISGIGNIDFFQDILVFHGVLKPVSSHIPDIPFCITGSLKRPECSIDMKAFLKGIFRLN